MATFNPSVSSSKDWQFSFETPFHLQNSASGSVLRGELDALSKSFPVLKNKRRNRLFIDGPSLDVKMIY